MNKKILIQLILFFLLTASVLQSQTCSNCTSAFSNDTLLIKVSSTDSSNYIVTSGKTLCIFPGGKFTGTVTLSGGFICNKGNFNPKLLTINSGTITNNSICKLKGLTLAQSRSIKNCIKSIMNIDDGNLILSGGSFINEGILNVENNIQNNSGSLINRSIINCNQFSGSNSITNLGIINTN